MAVAAAEPLLASALVSDAELDRLFGCVLGGNDAEAQARAGERNAALRSGSKSVDGALGGGLEGGRVVGVWAEAGVGSEVCLAWLADSLLRIPTGTAAVVDTTGNFDVLRLYSFVFARLRDDAEALQALKLAEGLEDEAVEDVAAKVLDRVRIMRVFDLLGAMEAVSEVREELEGRKDIDIAPGDLLEKVKERGNELEQEKIEELEEQMNAEELEHRANKANSNEQKVEAIPKKTFIADSEDEDDEMLFDNEPLYNSPPAQSSNHAQSLHQDDEILLLDGTSDGPLLKEQTAFTGLEPSPTQPPPTFLLIDNISQVIQPLLKKDFNHAQSLATSFLLTLSHLTRTHMLHTILLNPCTSPKLPPTTNHNPPNTTPKQSHTHNPPPTPSIFASNKLELTLSGLLCAYIDLGLLVSKMPRGKSDARAFYRDGDAVRVAPRGVKMAGVLEVVADRWDGRGGGWGSFVAGEMGIGDS